MAKFKGKKPKKGKRSDPPPILPSPPNYDLEPPVFSFRYLDKTHGLDRVCWKTRKNRVWRELQKSNSSTNKFFL